MILLLLGCRWLGRRSVLLDFIPLFADGFHWYLIFNSFESIPLTADVAAAAT